MLPVRKAWQTPGARKVPWCSPRLGTAAARPGRALAPMHPLGAPRRGLDDVGGFAVQLGVRQEELRAQQRAVEQSLLRSPPAASHAAAAPAPAAVPP